MQNYIEKDGQDLILHQTFDYFLSEIWGNGTGSNLPFDSKVKSSFKVLELKLSESINQMANAFLN